MLIIELFIIVLVYGVSAVLDSESCSWMDWFASDCIWLSELVGN